MFNMITAWGSCCQSLCACTRPNYYTIVSTKPPFFWISQQIFQQKTLCAHTQQPFSPTLLHLIQAHVYNLPVKGTVQPTWCSLYTHWRYFIRMKIPSLKEIHFKEFYCSQLTRDNENLLYLSYTKLAWPNKGAQATINMKVLSQIFTLKLCRQQWHEYFIQTLQTQNGMPIL